MMISIILETIDNVNYHFFTLKQTYQKIFNKNRRNIIMEKYYAVKNGLNKGIFTSWEETQKNIDGYSNSIFNSFPTLEEAEQYMEDPVSFSKDDKNIYFFYQDKVRSFPLNEIEKLNFENISDDMQITSRITEIIQSLLNENIQKAIEGVENTEDGEEDSIFEPYNPDQVKYTTKPFTMGTLHNYITGFDGEEDPTIDMNPDFQRNFVWTNKSKSSLIESILLNIPIPSIYLNQTTKNQYLPADGLQRLNAITEFLAGNLKLTGLEYLIQYNGYKYTKTANNDKILPIDIKRRIRDYSINCNIIESDTPDEVKLDIFKRLNSNGVKLSPQELRNSVTTKDIRDLYKEIEDDSYFTSMVMNGVNVNRFVHHELILRYFGAYLWQIEEYKDLIYEGNMKKFLDRTLTLFKNDKRIDVKKIVDTYKKSLKNDKQLFGIDAFRKPYEVRKGPLNTVLYTQILVRTINSKPNFEEKEGYMKEKFNNYLLNNNDFWLSISSATNNVANIRNANKYIEDFLESERLL